MNSEKIIELISHRALLIRTEAGYSQETMATILGISKKRLFKLRKSGRWLAGRLSCRWLLFLSIVKSYNRFLEMRP